MGEGTFVGLDVHARSVVAGLIDEATGEVVVRRRRIAPTSWPNSWHAPCVRASSARCGCPIRQTRPPATWCAPARAPAPT